MTRSIYFLLLCLALSCIATASARSVRPSNVTRTHGHRRHRHKGSKDGHTKGHTEDSLKETLFPLADFNSAAGTASTTDVPLTYKNGSVYTNGVDIYLIWYGNWNQQTANASSKSILRKFIASLGRKAPLKPNVNTVRGWFDTLLPYYQYDGAHVSPQIRLAGELTDNYSCGTSIGPNSDTDGSTGPDYQSIMDDALKKFPSNPKGIYFILPSPDVQVDGWCVSGGFCGFHSTEASGMAYAMVPNPATSCGGHCGEGADVAPNGDVGMDSMVDTFGHELAETITDPEVSGWVDDSGEENGDKCAHVYSDLDTHATPAGAAYNLVGIKNQKFHVQMMWSIESQSCVLNTPTIPRPPSPVPPCKGGGTCVSIFKQAWFGKYLATYQMSPLKKTCVNLAPNSVVNSLQINWNQGEGNPDGAGCSSIYLMDNNDCYGTGNTFDLPEWSTSLNSYGVTQDTNIGIYAFTNVKSILCNP